MGKRSIILIVDDMEVNRIILKSIFEKEYMLLEAENGEQAMVLANQYHDKIAAVLLDIVMPVKDDYQVLTELGGKGYLKEFPVVVITAEDSAENEVKVFDLGASDIIVKPFEPHVVKRRVQNNIELNLHKQNQDELIEEQASKLRESNAVMIDALSSIIEYRSVETGQHIHRIRMFTKILLEDIVQSYPEFLLDERKINIIVSASAMHDIGKIAIPDAILNKPGRLTQEEFEIMKTHAAKGSEMLAGLSRMADREFLQYAYNICRYHHERWDGNGYPEGLKADSIPVCAQVVGVADCYDALTTDRVYKKAIVPEQAFNMILNGECGSFSPKLMESFKNVQATFAHLSADYADNKRKTYEKIDPVVAKVKVKEGMLDTLRLGQMKYFTLLKYTDATVVELDWTTGTYHVVYFSSDDFALLKSGKYFSDSIREFAKKSIHPDDQASVLDLIDEYIDKFFNDGLMRRTRHYRVYSRAIKDYRWCEATLLRIDAEDPRQRRALVIWREKEAPEKNAAVFERHNKYLLQNVMGGTQMMRNDKWLTMPKVGDYLLNLLGYTAEEFKEGFNNRFINLISPAYQKDIFEQIKSQTQQGTQVELEYQVVAKDGHIIWLFDKSRLVTSDTGEEYFYNILIDITKTKSVEEELRLLTERQRIIMDQTNDMILEWDVATDKLSYSPNCQKRLGYLPLSMNASQLIPKASHVHPDDFAKIANLFKVMKNGQTYDEIDFRIANGAGQYCWYRLRVASQFDASGRTCRVVGVMADIDEEKRGLEVLQNKAERDGLTKLYNKQTAIQKISSYLDMPDRGNLSALFIIDVDDFKMINDCFGHMTGDLVLKAIAGKLQNLFRADDVIARIGGDEFLVYMQNVPSKKLVVSRTRQIIEALQKICIEDMDAGMLGCSIGIAYCPEHGTTFEELFIRSDRALYAAKFQGKNDYREYDFDTMEEAQSIQMIKSGANTRIDSEKDATFTSPMLIEEIFRQLYEATDNNQAINTVLELTAYHFNLDRAYIFEEDFDGKVINNTYEWCKKNISELKDSSQGLSYSSLGHPYREIFDKEGMFYCKSTSNLPYWQRLLCDHRQAKTIMQIAMVSNGAFKGFIGFDDCEENRVWPEEKITTLHFISRMITMFLVKKRAEERATILAKDLKQVLDRKEMWVYVIDPETFMLKYFNDKMRKTFPDIHEEAICYRLFFHKNSPCAQCPLVQTGTGMQTAYTHKKNDIQSSTLEWGGKKYWLMTSESDKIFHKKE